jgi:hypothetical protein
MSYTLRNSENGLGSNIKLQSRLNKRVVNSRMRTSEVVRRPNHSSVKHTLTFKQFNIPLHIPSLHKTNINLLGETINIALPLTQLRRNTIIRALQDLAALVPVALAVKAVLIAAAVGFDAGDIALNRGDGDVEAVEATWAGAAGFPAGDVPGPV